MNVQWRVFDAFVDSLRLEMTRVHIKRHRDIPFIFSARVNLRAARKTRPAVPFADHQTERGPEIVVGDGEWGLGFFAERGTADERRCL
jgi:hypothetical protein